MKTNYIKQIKQLPKSMVNDTLTNFQMATLIVLMLGLMGIAALCIHYKLPQYKFID